MAVQFSELTADMQIKIASFTNKLLELCQKGTTIQQLLDVGYETLGNPLLLVDISLCFMAHAGGNTIKNEPLWEWTLSKGYVTEQYVNSIMENNVDEDNGQTEDSNLILWEYGLLNHRQLVGNVLKNRQSIAYLKILEYNKPITEYDEHILITLCKFLSLTIKNSNENFSSINPLVDSFITALINQKLYDHDAINERARAFNLKLYDNLYVITIELNNTNKNQDRIYYLKRKMQNYFNRDTIIIYDKYIVVLFDVKSENIFNANELSLFNKLLEKYNCRAGISKTFHNLYDLSEYYKQTITSLSIGKQLHSSQRILNYDDYIVTHMILSFGDKAHLNLLIHPIVKFLIRIDKEKNSDFFETLCAYLKHNQDVTLTSKALHIHYNTLKYRINRITELTNIDFDDSELLFEIQLSEKVLKLIKQIGNEKM
ncbi:helix-turn-helix domain-containing protein [Clostridium sp. PL3]|uniref:Helix-turn-helix domain-containing protein n=1 Tax=Clostridium thailandense TaxID=2794346 RepID=A0A949WV88_9CLOT|nr:helix-turn-helix domain-containing protein [Clostridium thailandense]MBV7273412.1 helix-turn-helix domain-containing protein [Clostridium thailandense]